MTSKAIEAPQSTRDSVDDIYEELEEGKVAVQTAYDLFVGIKLDRIVHRRWLDRISEIAHLTPLESELFITRADGDIVDFMKVTDERKISYSHGRGVVIDARDKINRVLRWTGKSEVPLDHFYPLS
jgi:hypothetical protein